MLARGVAARPWPLATGIICLVAIGSGCRPPESTVETAAAPPVATWREVTGRVVAIADGDTLTLLVGERQEKIRLHGIDAPESGQPFGDRSKRQLSSLCFGQTVEIERLDTDRYGRTIAIVYAGDTNINRAMLEAGLAWHYVKYDQSADFAAAEESARGARRGLWADQWPLAPWEWRRKTPAERAAYTTRGPAPLAQAPLAAAPEASATKTYWLNTKSGARHNAGCKWYGNTKNGRPCTATEGKACGICGG